MGPKGKTAPSANMMRLRNHPMAQSRSHGYKMERLLVHGDVQVSPPPAGPPDTLSLATVSCFTPAASPPLTWHTEWTSLDQPVLHEPYLSGMALPATGHITALGDVGLGTSSYFPCFCGPHLPQATLAHLPRPWFHTASLSFLLLLVLPSMSSDHSLWPRGPPVTSNPRDLPG